MRLTLLALEVWSKAIFLSLFFSFSFFDNWYAYGDEQWQELTSTRVLLNKQTNNPNNGEFDPGSGLTLAACLTHASQGERSLRGAIKLADG